jgi:hypothetical protein
VFAGQVVGDPRPAVVVLLLGHAAQAAELEIGPLAHGPRAPGARALNQQDGAARGEAFLQEPFQGTAQGEPFEPQVGHGFEHRPVLGRVVHVVDGHFGVVPGDEAAGRGQRHHRTLRVVGVRAQVTHRYQQRLGKVGRAQCGREMDGGAAGRADNNDREGPPPVLPDHPVGEIVGVDAPGLLQRDSLHRPHAREGAAAHPDRQRGSHLRQRPGPGSDPHPAVVLPA